MKLLICSDGSAAAENAVHLGGLIAAGNAEVVVLGIIESPGKADAILDALRRTRQWLEEKKIRAELVTVTGQAVEEIAKRTDAAKFDMVVIGAALKSTRGLFWMSSKTYKIIKAIHPPVLVVMEKTTTIKRILICARGRKDYETAVTVPGQIALGMQASVTLFHVMPEPPALYARLHRMEVSVAGILHSKSELGKSLSAQKKLLESLGVPVEVKLRQGSVMGEIFREIHEGNYDMVVTGSSISHGRLRNYVLGDITREIVNRCHCPVLVVRAGSAGQGIINSAVGWINRVTGHKQAD